LTQIWDFLGAARKKLKVQSNSYSAFEELFENLSEFDDFFGKSTALLAKFIKNRRETQPNSV
jgi:hypothetical protein